MAILNIVPAWLPSGSLLEQTFKLVITNLGDQVLPANSVLKFTLGKYQTALNPTTGFNDFSQVGNVVEGHLTNEILPKEIKILNIKVKLVYPPFHICPKLLDRI